MRPIEWWSAPCLWPGERVVCVAAGPSLTQEDVERVRGRARTVVINWIWKLAPWADCLYACDREWWESVEAPPIGEGPTLKVTLGHAGRPDVHVLQFLRNATGVPGLATDPAFLRTGKNGGHQAINLSAHLVGRGGEIILLGYDFKFQAKGVRHCHPDHAAPLNNPEPNAPVEWIKWAGTIPPAAEAMGVRILNATRDTALTCFPQASLEELFP